jgi:hypothetical protein
MAREANDQQRTRRIELSAQPAARGFAASQCRDRRHSRSSAATLRTLRKRAQGAVGIGAFSPRISWRAKRSTVRRMKDRVLVLVVQSLPELLSRVVVAGAVSQVEQELPTRVVKQLRREERVEEVRQRAEGVGLPHQRRRPRRRLGQHGRLYRSSRAPAGRGPWPAVRSSRSIGSNAERLAQPVLPKALRYVDDLPGPLRDQARFLPNCLPETALNRRETP